MRCLTLNLVFICFAASLDAQNLCYSEQRDCERGYVGQIGKTRFYYEVWNVDAAAGMHYNSLLLWTDTSTLEGIDFCFDMENQSDSIYFRIQRGDSAYNYVSRDTRKIPGLFQALIPVTYTFNQYYNFNDTLFSQKLYIRNKRLYLVYMHSPRYDKAYVVTEIYDLRKGRFVLSRSYSKPIED